MGARAELVEALERSRDGRGRVRPRADVKQRVVSYAVGQLERGEPVGRLAEQLGVGQMTLRRWLERYGESRSGELVAVRVADIGPNSPRSGFVVHLGAGLRIEGMTVTEVAELVQRLV